MTMFFTLNPKLLLYLLAIFVLTCDSSLLIDKKLTNEDNFVEIDSQLSPESLDNIHRNGDRLKRSPENSITNSSVPNNGGQHINEDHLSQYVTTSALNDSHQQLTVHWSGKGSPVIICLAKNRPQNTNISSAVYISHNYGKDFSKVTAFVLENGTNAVVTNFYISPAINSHYIFVDSINNYLFITKDYGKTFKPIELGFSPKTLSLHSTNIDLILLSAKPLDDNSGSSLYLSEDFGSNWRLIQSSVKMFSWGIEAVDTVINVNMVYVQRQEPNGLTTVLSSNDFFSNNDNTKMWLKNVEELEISGKYMFATRRLKLLGNLNHQNHTSKSHESYQLWVSYERQPFRRALFSPINLTIIDYYIADASEEVVMACLTFNDSSTHLYTSGENGSQFSLSLKNIVYFAPNISKPGLGLEWTSDEPLADIHKVAGIRGIYIASKFKEPKKSIADLITVISFDMGSKWQRIRPPFIDSDGAHIDCSISNNCSLHLSQKFSYLYPHLRLPPIVSRQSAVGLIMASGVVGTSIKGKPNVYLSIDAGLTWHQVLNGNYIFAFGDFGAIIVAISYYSKNGATNELKYSIDDGENWSTLKFSKEKIRIYGLMTEPGEKTTVFTLFGSKEEGKHEWAIVQVNLTKVFKGQCSLHNDYKEWSPHDVDTGCLLGRREVFQRRIANHKCFNGQQYIRPVGILNCPCRHSDYQCDVGFVRDKTGIKCEFSGGSDVEGFDPYSVPKWCKVGKVFNRTRGYRKISGDTCFGGEEDWYSPQTIPCPFSPGHDDQFVLFVQRQSISRLLLNEDKPVKESLVPQSYLINAIAADFDHKHNCLYWSDIGIDKIMRLCLDGQQTQPEVLVETGLESVEGIALNPIDNHLYFVDGEQAKVELIRTDVEFDARMRRTIISKPNLEKPRGIALNIISGYIFLTDWGNNNPGIIRCELDGDNVKVLFNSTVVSWPNGIAVDYVSQKIFWVDAKRDYIASSDFDGKHLTYVSEGEQTPHPFALGVFKDYLYFDDWNLQQIVMISKVNGKDRKVILSDINGAMDLKIITPGFRETTNVCSSNTTNNCSHLCVSKPFDGHKCLCPDGYVVERTTDGNEKCNCLDGEELHKLSVSGEADRYVCQTKHNGSSCNQEEFTCDNGNCIQKLWRCDRDNDCGDNSDEKDCDGHKCNENEFQCRTNKCIPIHWKCDFDSDCMDGSDEDINMCQSIYPKCSPNEFQCQNRRCIDKKLVCDLEDNCRDGSDEINCGTKSTECKDDEFKCNNGDCILAVWKCDGDIDCRDKSDETSCSKISCSSWQFSCDKNGSSKCIFKTWVCDGEYDCPNHSDEENCPNNMTVITEAPHSRPTTDTDTLDGCAGDWFRCQTGTCVPLIWKCDSVDDCGDDSDELGCSQNATTLAPAVPPPVVVATNDCGSERYQCHDRQCIWDSWLCDGQNDCQSGEDEDNCKFGPKHCSPEEFKCVHSMGCIPLSDVCNGKDDCGDDSDEWGCHNQKTDIVPHQKCIGFVCKSGECIESYKRCNRRPDCFDLSDEDNCSQTFYAVRDLTIDFDSINSTSFTIKWKTPNSSLNFYFIPTISRINTNDWQNKTDIKNDSFTFTGLQPGVMYNVSVYCRLTTERVVFPLLQYITVSTESIAPSPPLDVIVKEITDNRVLVSWSAPKMANNLIKGYRVYYSPPTPPMKQTVSASKANQLSINKQAFEAGVRYIFWVTTLTTNLESENSNKTSLIISSIVNIKDLNAKNITNSSATIEWSTDTTTDRPIKWFIEYHSDDYFIGTFKTNTTDKTEYTFTGLAPGVNYQFKILPIIDGQTLTSGIEDNIISVRTEGVVLPSVSIIDKRSTLTTKGIEFQLSWNSPKYLSLKQINWTFGLFYGLSENKLKLYNKTDETRAVLKNLMPCETYIVQIRVLEPFGIGPAVESTVLNTPSDPIAPPKNLKYKLISTDKTKYWLSWNSSCDRKTDTRLGYKIYIKDLVKNIVNRFQLTARNDTAIDMPLIVHFGALYEIKVSTDQPNARFTEPVRLRPMGLPQVQKLFGLQQVNGSLYIYWKNIDDEVWPKELKKNHSFEYKVYISQTPNIREADVVTVKAPPLSYPAEYGKFYHVAVAVSEEHGYSGPISDWIPIDNPLNSVIIAKKSMIGVVIGISIIVIALVVALSIFVYRHRRLQRSFLSFASSHYNTRSGSATFTTNDGLEEDDETPVFRGFSDDEPLVLA